MNPPSSAATPLASRLSYAQCWEDPTVLLEALSPAPGSNVLSIASAGDNSIALALAGARVVAIDLSQPQLAITELKLAGWRLDYHSYLVLLGLEPGNPLAQYRALRPHLSRACRAFFDEHHDKLRAGLLDSGRFERYLALFRRRVLPLVHGRRTIHALLEPMPAARRPAFYRERWDTWRWRAMFRFFFSRALMARLGRSPEQFAQVQGAVADRIMGRARQVLSRGGVEQNPFIQWILLGSYRDLRNSHPYLSPRGHRGLREAASRVHLLHAPIEEHLATCSHAAYDAFNLSNIGEYMSAGAFESLYRAILAAAAPGARLAYWNLLVPRACPERFQDRVLAHHERCSRLLARDRVPFYGAFRLEIAQ